MLEKLILFLGALFLLDCVHSTPLSVRGISNQLGCNFNNNTCSPVGCSYVSNSACTPTTSITNAQIIAQISAGNCNSTCTTSTNPICTAKGLQSLLSKGINGVNSIKAAYCTDMYLVVQSNGMPNHNDSLTYIPRPPGGGGIGGYASQCVTRSHVIQSFTWRIPLNPVALTTSSASINNVAALNANGNKLTTAALPNNGPTGMTITGLPIFPPYNNEGGLTWLACEVDRCNTHAGQGFDYHYHGDPFGPNCMYSTSDYASTTSHPPLIGYGLDGFPIYGRYLDDSAPGYIVALDDCGGHLHSPDTNNYGYHYHAQVISQTVSQTANGLVAGQSYTAFIPGPYKCWKGDITKYHGFWTKNGYTSQCCSINVATQSYLTSGATLKTTSTPTTTTTVTTPTTTSTSTTTTTKTTSTSTTTTSKTTSTSTTSTSTKTTSSLCLDSQSNCVYWSSYCSLLVNIKPHPCPKTCKLC